MKGRYLRSVAAIVMASALGSSAAWAADAVADPDEIIVTAQKRNENVQNVPAAITAISGAALKETAPLAGWMTCRRSPPRSPSRPRA